MTRIIPTSTRGRLVTFLGAGLAATLLVLAGLAYDQLGPDSIGAHARRVYAAYGPLPDSGVLYLFLYVIFGAGALCWGLALLGARRRWPRLRGWITSFCVLGTGAATFVSMVSEYGSPILPPLWRIAGWVIVAIGIPAVVLAWKVSGRNRVPRVTGGDEGARGERLRR